MSKETVERLRERIRELEAGLLWKVSALQDRVYKDATLHDLIYEALEHSGDPLHLLDMLARLQGSQGVPVDIKTALVIYVRERVREVLTEDLEESEEEEGSGWHGYEPEELQGAPEDLLEQELDLDPEDPAEEYDYPRESVAYSRQQAYKEDGRSWRKAGILSVSGYHVGKTMGLGQEERRRILNWLVLKDDLLDVEDREYAAEWGDPWTSDRLKKIVDSIAVFARDRRDDPRDYSIAIEHWQEDLEYLRTTFYVPWEETWRWPRE